jgi:hypothetical protein
MSGIFDGHIKTMAAGVAIPVFAQQFGIDADGIPRVAPRTVTDRHSHRRVQIHWRVYEAARLG